MENSNYLEKVRDFMIAFGQPVHKEPHIAAKSRGELRIRLIQEELDELKEAFENEDIVEVADALVDLQYVLTGAIHEFGLGKTFNDLFNEVHNSNMSKLLTEKEIQATINYYTAQGVEVDVIQISDNLYSVNRKSDYKVLKNVNWKEPDLKNIIYKEQNTISFKNEQEFEDFKTMYNDAVINSYNKFKFKDKLFLTAYAKYLIEYVELKLM